MIDSVQFVLLFVIIVLTVLLVALGVQVFFILREVRRTLLKANKVLETADTITEAVSGSVSSLGSITSIFGSGTVVTVLKVVRAFLKNKHSKDKENIDE